MEAALVARKRGHAVLLFERERQLGGLIRIAARAPFRQEWTELLDFKARQCAAAGVELRLGVAADAAAIAAARADAVVVATGSLPSRPAVEGAELEFATTASEVLAGQARLGTRVVVVDQTHRMHAPSVALHLAEHGHAVEIVTESTHVGSKLESQNMTFVTRELMRRGVRLTPFTALAALEPRTAWTRNVMTGEIASIDEVDAVVFATPGRADDALFHALQGAVAELHAIGDCYTPRDVEAAILEGHRVGRAL
jgi:NADPH-dependent glutamate synthase beta subunit-like oxidoreductase